MDDDSATPFHSSKKDEPEDWHRFLAMSPEQAARVQEAIVQLSVEPPKKPNP